MNPFGLCAACGATFPPGALVCSGCGALAHRDRLATLAQQAERAPTPSAALGHWREALDLLPPDSVQHQRIREKMADLSRSVDAPAPKRDFTRWGGLAAVAAILWNSKTFLLLGLGKLKYLAVGLSKLPTLLTMFASFGVYAALWGWRFAAGFILCIYVHEIGHVVALRQFGIAATAPMFIPGFGAVVRMKQYPSTPREDARVGIAGPVWGAGASAAALGLSIAFHSPMMLAICATSAIINLFNLIPIGSLDGGRAYRGMTRAQRLGVGVALGLAWFIWHAPMTFIVALVLIGRTLGWRDAPPEGDWTTTIWFGLLGFVLTWMASDLPVV